MKVYIIFKIEYNWCYGDIVEKIYRTRIDAEKALKILAENENTDISSYAIQEWDVD